jgi:uncharacterized membrane-anchored protein
MSMRFKPGSGYGEFNSGSHRVAEYGLAGLIAGGVLLKAGFFKALLVGLAALWKPIATRVIQPARADLRDRIGLAEHAARRSRQPRKARAMFQ